MALNVDRFLSMVMTQGAADAFVQGTLATNIVPKDGMVWVVSLIEFNFTTATPLSGITADTIIHWSFSRDTKTAICLYDDIDCIFADGMAIPLNTNGQVIVPLRYEYVPPEGLLIVEPTIYGQLDSTGLGTALTAAVRIHYQEAKATEVEILRLLNNA